MEEKRPQAEHRGQRRPVRRPARKKRTFLIVYLAILAVLLVISACVLSYVHRSLEKYEASQPENILCAQIEKLREGESSGNGETILSFETLRREYGVTEEEIAKFKQEFLAGEVTFREDYTVTDPGKKVYHVLMDGVKMAKATLNHQGQETRMLVFTMDSWAVEPMEVIGYSFQLTAPASAIIKNNGQVLEGQAAENGVTYSLNSLSPIHVEICDVLGNSVPYDAGNLPVFTDYQITIPSNYTIMGVEAVPVELATVEPISQLEYVREYCPQVPDRATYVLSLLSGSDGLKILDPDGKEVAYTMEGRKITVDGPVGQDTLPGNVDVNPLDVAKLWSLFMTADLTGANYGYGQLSPYLIKGSYLQSVAWKWATGIDITFTSSHTLKDPAFQVEEVSNYVMYAEDCFSCDIRLEKTMVLTRTGEEVKDVINSRFYFVNYDDTDNGISDPHWVLVDYQEIH